MAKTIFGTSEKSNFILNMNIDKYRAFCAKFLPVLLWMTAVSAGIYQLTYSVNGKVDEVVSGGGFSTVVGLAVVALRSVATFFSIGGVAAIIMMVIGLMRKEITKQTAIPYCLLLASLIWGYASVMHAFDELFALFGHDGRDEGWIALLMYAAMFFVGSMLRCRANILRFLDAVMVFGIVQGVWGVLQAQPWFDFPTEYKMIEPLQLYNVRLPSGLTDSPVTFALLLSMLLCVSIPCAIAAKEKKRRIIALICAGLSMLLVFKTQTIAGVIAGIGALLLTAVYWCLNRKTAPGKKWLTPAVMAAAAVLSVGWVYISPSLNGTVNMRDDSAAENGFVLYDGGIVWDDGSFRLSTAGPYSSVAPHDFEISDPVSVLRFCRSEGIRVNRKYPVFGTGPDNFSFTQLHSSLVLQYNPNTIDRPYDDYLFIAATRGILSLVLQIALLAVCLWLAWRNRKMHTGWYFPAVFSAVVLYSIAITVGISVLTVAPLFWMLLGILAGDPLPDPVVPEAAAEADSASES